MPRLRNKPGATSTQERVTKPGGAPPAVRRCHRCRGSGSSPCSICGGKGKVMVHHGAEMTARSDVCQGCFGRKTSRCSACAGSGLV